MKLRTPESSSGNKLWDVMNDLQMISSKIVSAREIIDSVAEAIQRNDYNKAETLAMAAFEFLGYYLDEFDDKFQLAWRETVVKQKEEIDEAWDVVNKEKEYYEPSMPPWGHSDLEYMIANPTLTEDRISNFPGEQYPEEVLNAMCDAAEKEHNKKSWYITVEEAYNKDGETIFSYIQLPDELIERMGLNESSYLRWITNEDGTVTIKKS